MANNVTIPAQGTGDTTPVVATEDITSVHYQLVKLVDGTATGTGRIGGDATNGLDVDVTRLPALVAGTANIGDVDVLTIAAGDNNIGNVDLASAIPAGTNNIGDVDVLTIAAGDNNIGNVDIVTMPNVTLAAGTNTNEVVGDAAHDAVVAGNPVLIAGASSAAAPTAVSADGDAVRAWFLLNGAQATVLTAAGALIGGDAANGLDVDVTRLPALVAGTANIGDVDVLTLPALVAGTANIGDVDVLTIAAGDNNIGNVDIVTLPGIVGTIADDATTPGAPVMVGGSAISPDGTDPGSVSAEADVARIRTDLNRRVLVNTAHPNHWSYHLNTSTAQTDTAVAADPGDGFQLVITDIVFSSGAATAINMFLEEGATTILGPYYLEAVAGRGMALHFTTGKFVTASTALTITTSASIAHAVDIMGYIQAV